jgi:protein O-GlcNAc transferase
MALPCAGACPVTDLAQALADHRAGQLDRAEAAYGRLLADSPDHAEILHLLAVIALQRGQPAEALPLAQRSVAVDADQAKPWNTLGNALAALARDAEAVTALERAIALDPTLLPAHRNLAILQTRLGRLTEAESRLRTLLTTFPDDAELHSDLGALLRMTGKADDADRQFRRALALKPDLGPAAFNIGIRARELGDVAAARSAFAGLSGGGARLLSATALPAIPGDEAEITQARRDYEDGLDALLADPPHIADPLTEIGQVPQFYLAYHGRDDRPLQDKLARLLRASCPSLTYTAAHCLGERAPMGRKLRLGMVSRHFYHHTIGKLQVGCIAHLPRDHFEITVFAPTGRDDPLARRIRAGADHVVPLPNDLDAARTTIAEAQLDVLLYPDIGMEPFTYFLSFARLAPLQITTWGHPVTPAVGTIDWFVSAASIERPGAQADYAEKLALLTHPCVYFHRPAPPPPRDRSHYGLPESARLYVCPQTLFKLHPGFDRLVAEILRRDPKGLLVLIAGRAEWRQAVERRLAATAPDIAARVHFVPTQPEPDFIALCGLADVMLDIPTFSGGNTTLEALSMGTPIVTLPTRFMRGRLSAGMLHWAGLDWGVASDEADYVAKAIAIAAEPEIWRRQVRDGAPVLYEDRARLIEFERFLLDAR